MVNKLHNAMPFGQFDATNPVERTQAETLSRRQAVQMTQAMREFGGEELANIEPIGAGPQLGVRATRRVEGGLAISTGQVAAPIS